MNRIETQRAILSAESSWGTNFGSNGYGYGYGYGHCGGVDFSPRQESGMGAPKDIEDGYTIILDPQWGILIREVIDGQIAPGMNPPQF